MCILRITIMGDALIQSRFADQNNIIKSNNDMYKSKLLPKYIAHQVTDTWACIDEVNWEASKL